jgi:hypothetical protein
MNTSSRLTLHPALLVCAALLAGPAALAAEPQRYAVMPFAALAGDVPPRAGHKAAGMLTTELKNVEGLQVQDGKKASTEPVADRLAAARAQLEEAKNLRTQRKFGKAEEVLKRALADYKTHASILTDVGEVADAYALLAAVQYNTGRDDDGLKSLKSALNVAPGRELPLAKTSPSFSKLIEQTRAAVESGPKGTLVIQSVPSGAPVFVDGIALGKTPLSVRDIPPGMHHYRVPVPSGEPAGGLVEVEAQKTAQISAAPQGTDPEAKLAAALAKNKLDDTAVAAAKAWGQSAQASDVVFGALDKDGGALALYPFVVNVSSGQVRRLAKATFDAELLSAGVELLKLAGEVPKGSESAKLPSAVAPEKMDSREKPAEVRYSNRPSQAEATTEPASTGEPSRAPLDSNKRKPLARPK